MLVKVLGAIDLASAFAFLMLVFGINPFFQYLLFCAGLLFVKSFFIVKGDVLSWVDLGSSIILIISMFFLLPVILYWIPAFFLLAKGFVSFL
jgi:hypothetical protein